ncbi:MAG: ADP-ribosylation factor-like protein [Promethearchaeota archaeon]
MLRQIYITSKKGILYQRNYARGLDDLLFQNILSKIQQDAFSEYQEEIGYYDFFKYKISFITEKKLGLLILFITSLKDNFDNMKTKLYQLRQYMLDFHGKAIERDSNFYSDENLDIVVDTIHKEMHTKIALVGYAGVGKTTISNLIKEEELPTKHIPTINGEISTIKLGKLHFQLWDFAGQEQYELLWKKFIRESDVVLLISDSSFENVEKSRSFIDLIKQEASDSNSAIICNKQDLSTSIQIDTIQNLIGLKAYPMVAIDPDNKEKMILIIAELLEIDPKVSPLLKSFTLRTELQKEAENALSMGDHKKALEIYQKIYNLCIDSGDYSYEKDYREKIENLKKII